MKKSIAILLALITVLTMTFVACSTEKTDTEDSSTTTDADGLDANSDDYILEDVEVTDENGKTVTDSDGNAVTEQVAFKVETDDKGNQIIVQMDNEGNEVTNKNGEKVTIKPPTTDAQQSEDDPIPSTTTTKATNVATSSDSKLETTESKLTTISSDKDKVPTLSETGKAVAFSQADANTVANMLMVPYLYNNNYENADGVPTNIAAHAAMWMAQREGLNTSVYASGTIVLDLFKFFGQTVVNFKSKCNTESSKDYNIKYNTNDTFTITSFETKTHSVSNLKFYHIGNNNYYKVEGTVSGCKYKKVVAIIQRNKLDSSLGFSIKALKWS